MLSNLNFTDSDFKKSLFWLESILKYRSFDDQQIHKYIMDHFEQNIKIPTTNDPNFLKFIKIIEKSQRILVIGDYDADGILSSSILNMTLKTLSKEVDFYLPNRYTDGYGLNNNTLNSIDKKLGLKKYDLIITIDNGISSVNEVNYLTSNGIKVIIIDHHSLPKILPSADLIIHPLLTDLGYKYLCASGIAYKIGTFLLNYSKDKSKYDIEKDILYFSGLGTLADVVPLLDENRRISKKMINLSKNNYMPFILRKIWEKVGYKNYPASSFDFSFILIPRINAPGRIKSADIILELILLNYYNFKEELLISKIKEIEEINNYRQKLQEILYNKVMNNIKAKGYFRDHFIIPDYLESDIRYLGVMGIVAGKIANEYNKPCAVFVKVGQTIKGSVRNPIDEVNITDLISNLALYTESIGDKMIKKYGGHSKAAGIELETNYFDKFRELINLKLAQLYNASKINPNIKNESKYSINIPFYFMESFINNLKNINEIMEPYGEKNDKPSIKIPLTEPIVQEILKNLNIFKKNETYYVALKNILKDKEIFINFSDSSLIKKIQNINKNNAYIILKHKSISNNKFTFDLVDIITSDISPKIEPVINFWSNFVFEKEVFFINAKFKNINRFIDFIKSYKKFYLLLDNNLDNNQLNIYNNKNFNINEILSLDYLKTLREQIYFITDLKDFINSLKNILNQDIKISDLSVLYANNRIYKGLLIIIFSPKAKPFYQYLKNNKDLININFNLILINCSIIDSNGF